MMCFFLLGTTFYSPYFWRGEATMASMALGDFCAGTDGTQALDNMVENSVGIFSPLDDSMAYKVGRFKR